MQGKDIAYSLMKVRVLRKIDIGLIAVRITDEERKQIDAIWSELKA